MLYLGEKPGATMRVPTYGTGAADIHIIVFCNRFNSSFILAPTRSFTM